MRKSFQHFWFLTCSVSCFVQIMIFPKHKIGQDGNMRGRGDAVRLSAALVAHDGKGRMRLEIYEPYDEGSKERRRYL